VNPAETWNVTPFLGTPELDLFGDVVRNVIKHQCRYNQKLTPKREYNRITAIDNKAQSIKYSTTLR
jgi:hypothetical protein